MSQTTNNGRPRKWPSALMRGINNMHIYSSFKEALIKTLVFIASWVISVFCYFGGVSSSGDPSGSGAGNTGKDFSTLLGGAVVLFSISFLLEVIDRLSEDDPFPKRILSSLVVFSSAICLTLGLLKIFVSQINLDSNQLIIICSIPVIVYVCDSVTHWLIPDKRGLNGGKRMDQSLRSITF